MLKHLLVVLSFASAAWGMEDDEPDPFNHHLIYTRKIPEKFLADCEPSFEKFTQVIEIFSKLPYAKEIINYRDPLNKTYLCVTSDSKNCVIYAFFVKWIDKNFREENTTGKSLFSYLDLHTEVKNIFNDSLKDIKCSKNLIIVDNSSYFFWGTWFSEPLKAYNHAKLTEALITVLDNYSFA